MTTSHVRDVNDANANRVKSKSSVALSVRVMDGVASNADSIVNTAGENRGAETDRKEDRVVDGETPAGELGMNNSTVQPSTVIDGQASDVSTACGASEVASEANGAAPMERDADEEGVGEQEEESSGTLSEVEEQLAGREGWGNGTNDSEDGEGESDEDGWGSKLTIPADGTPAIGLEQFTAESESPNGSAGWSDSED